MTENLHAPTRRTSFDAERFRTPTTDDRPGFRWWWISPLPAEELVRELRAIHEAGFGEVEIAFSPGFWADDAQRAALGAVLREAEAIGIRVSMTLGAAWPLQTPNTQAGTEFAAKELQYGVAWLGGDGAGSAAREGLDEGGAAPTTDAPIPIPPPFDEEEERRAAELVGLVAARVLRRGSDPYFLPPPHPFGAPRSIGGPDDATLLDAESFIDLTDQVVDGGQVAGAEKIVRWSVPEGEWALISFWSRDCEQGVTSFLDANAARAALDYLAEHQIGEENRDILRRVGAELFEDSLELNADSLFWSPDFLDRFREYHGYDLRPYLPLVFAHGMCRYWVPNEEPGPAFDVDGDLGCRVRSDYNRLVTELYISDHLHLLHQWSTDLGLRHKSQAAYGQNLDVTRSFREFVRVGGRAEGESLNAGERMPMRSDAPLWRYSLDWMRHVVGGAHQGGASRISSELGAQFGCAFNVALEDYRGLMHKEWASGITKPFVHGFATQDEEAPWPTRSRFWNIVAESWNDQHFPEWGNWGAMTDYWARATVALESGIPRTDIAVYRDGFLTTGARGNPEEDATAPERLVDSEALEKCGYSVQFLDPLGIEAGDGSGDVLFGDGPAYRALVIDERSFPLRAARALSTAVQRGVRVVLVGPTPDSDRGWGGSDHSNNVRQIFSELLEVDRLVRCVDSWEEVPTALAEIGVHPRVSVSAPGVLSQYRELDDGALVLLYAHGLEGFDGEVTVELPGISGGAATELLDLWSGQAAPIPSSSGEGQVSIRLRIHSGEVALVRICPIHEAGGPPGGLDAENTAVTHIGPGGKLLPGKASSDESEVTNWSLRVVTEEPGESRTLEFPSQGPGDWLTIPELADISGVATYRAQAHIPNNAYLRLGEFRGSVRVRISGSDNSAMEYGPYFASGTLIDLRDIPAGEAAIEIDLATTLVNAAVKAEILDGGPWKLEVAAQPSGLIGAVHLGTWR
ncbi:MAG: glycosyl hydrolase [Actinomycetaceae bacterium]|nr:glycosyl hydrolase [Actinomycetaceae bacterium]